MMNMKNWSYDLCFLIATTSFLTAVASAQTNSGSAIQASELTQPGYTMPADLPATPTGNTYHQAACNYAWRMFFAANQQADTTRGTPASNSTFVSTGTSSTVNGPLVWESYYHRAEAYPFYTGTDPSTKPKPTTMTTMLPTYYMFQGKKKSPTAFTVKNGQWVNLDENNQIGQNMIFFPKGGQHAANYDQPTKDSQLLFMAKVNANELNYVWPMGRIVQNGVANPPLYFPTTESTQKIFPTTSEGTIEVKSAWRLASDIPAADQKRYHIAPATYYTEDENTGNLVHETANFALLALHIIRKTPNHPQFIFATFEQVDAITDSSGDATGLYYVPNYNFLEYFDPISAASQSPPTTPSKSQNPTATYKGASTSIKATTGNTSTPTTALPVGGTPPSGGKVNSPITVIQPKTITMDVINVNKQVHSYLPSGSVWKHYALKGVQSLTAFTDNFTKDPVTTKPDYYLANIVVESSQPGVQLFRGGPPGPNSLPPDDPTYMTLTPSLDTKNVTHPSNLTGPQQPNYTIGGCMGCHGVAQAQGFDFSFLAGALGEKGSTKATGFKPEPLLEENADVMAALRASARRVGAGYGDEDD